VNGNSFHVETPEILRRHPYLTKAAERRQRWTLLLPLSVGVSVVAASWWLGLAIDQFWIGLGHLAKTVSLMFPPSPGGHLHLLLRAMGETLAIAFLGTLCASLVAFPISFLAAKNTTPSGVFRFAVRRVLDTIRGIDVLIWALVFVGVVGLGPFAGILAIAVSDFGSFGKLFSEAIEGADRKPIEGVISTGGSQLHAIRFGLIPQVLPVILSQALYYFESNVRSATIIGIVGAGGIGLQLSEQIRTYEFDQVAFVIVMILLTVAVIDWICGKLRFAVIGRSAIAVA
jgi:phosphonate transport system permease protein